VRIFVAGASGAIGRPLVAMLVEDGHLVVGMTRGEERAARIREAGAEAAVCDVYDAARLLDAVGGAAPDVVIDQLTDIPRNLDPRRYEEQMAGNDRVRREGTRNLVDAALAAGAKRFVAQSVAFMYAPRGPMVVGEDAPLFLDAPPVLRRSVEALVELETVVTGTPGLDGIVLRYGYFYGPGTVYASDGPAVARVRRGMFPVVGDGSGTFSFVHVEDAARATRLAVERGAPGTYNVVDDEPAPMREWLPALAGAVGARRPRRVPVWLARRAGGPLAAEFARLRGASNAKVRRELGWEPRYTSWRQGFREGLG
jgi:2-alkyl-3-oxoalkanoate reductase